MTHHIDIVGAFITDLQMRDSVVQLSTHNRGFGLLTPDNWQNQLAKYEKHDLYYLQGVTPSAPPRAADSHVLHRNHFTIDIDVRSQWQGADAPCTQEDIFAAAADILNVFDGSVFGNWRYINCSGNGLHFHYFGEPVDITDKNLWKFGLKELFDAANKILEDLGWTCDPACVNVGRIMRVLGSVNVKDSKNPKPVENIYYNADAIFDTALIQPAGQKELDRRREDNKRKAKEQEQYIARFGDSTFDTINAVPIAPIVVELTGWDLLPGGKHFKDPSWPTKGAMFVNQEKNAYFPGGSKHAPNTQEGYSPYQYVKELLNLSDAETVQWFSTRYSAVQAASEAFQEARGIERAKDRSDAREVAQNAENAFVKETPQETPAPSPPQGADAPRLQNTSTPKKKAPPKLKTLDDLMGSLRSIRIDILETDPYLDAWKPLIRGGVTRIGGYSNMGKSTVAYYLINRLLHNGYHGLVFSTEVVSALVLASLERINTGLSTFQIAEEKKYDEERLRERYKNLMIYDSVDTSNNLKMYEALIEETRAQGHQIDFVMVDYVQGVRITERTAQTLYDKMTAYAMDIQQLAQRMNLCIIDVSQVNNESLNSTKGQKEADFVGLKGSGDLFSAAEVVINVSRKKGAEDNGKPLPAGDMVPRAAQWRDVELQIRKHKFAPTGGQWVKIDYATGLMEESSKPADADSSKGDKKFV